jgi:signal transduction histidine kinase
MRREPTVGRLLTGAFGILVGLTVCSGLVEVAAVLLQHATVEQLAGHVQPLQLANNHLRTVLADGQRGLRGYALTGDREMLGAYEVARGDYTVAVADLRRLGGRTETPAVDAQVAAADTWWLLATLERRAAPRSADTVRYAGEGRRLFQAFVDRNQALDLRLSARSAALHRRSETLQWVTVALVGVLTTGATVLVATTAMRTARRITRPLREVVEMLDRRRLGDRDVRTILPDGPAEIRALAEAVNAVADETEREQHLVARLQALDTAKTDFMSTVSHELRTPLTSISGYLELLLDARPGELSDAQVRMLEVIGRNTRRLRELIEDILTLSKIEQGGFRSDLTPVDLARVIERAVAAISPAAAKASVGLHLDVRGPLPLDGDAAQLDRALANLLSNAVKFSPAEGTVTVRAERRDGRTVLTVADTGMGIPEDEQQALFARFFRATNAIHHAIPGTGLGLAIVRTIVDNHGGTIDIASTEGVGTTVTVRLPTA